MIRDNRLGNTPRWYLTPPKDWHMRIPDDILRCVAFLGTRSYGDVGDVTVRGTAFFVAVPSERDPHVFYEYLVTAQHNLDQAGSLPLYVRVNRVGGDAQDIPLTNDPTRWTRHPTDGDPDMLSVDVAVLPWPASEDQYDYLCLPVTMLLTDEEIRKQDVFGNFIGPGDEVFLTGLFTKVTGRKTNQPIVLMGSIAMMPAEPIPTALGDMEAYLIGARSLRGLSGSPAFVRETWESGIGTFHLLGLIHGHWDVPEGAIEDVTSEGIGNRHTINSEVGIVAPAKKIREVLYHPDLVKDRTRQDRAREKRHWPTPDKS